MAPAIHHRSNEVTTGPAEPTIALVERAIDPRIVLFHAPASREAEQFRGLRNAVLSMNPERAPRSIAMVGSVRGEGTTTTAVNLALSLAEMAGTRVLLVDANLREPGVDHLLAMAQGAGLSEVLEDYASPASAIRPFLTRNVDVLSAGKRVENPAELLAKGRLEPLLHALKPNYSYIIIDTPPASDATDASLIARECDGVIFVVRLDLAPRTIVEQSLAQIRTLGANLLGTFVVGAATSGKVTPIDAASGA